MCTVINQYNTYPPVPLLILVLQSIASKPKEKPSILSIEPQKRVRKTAFVDFLDSRRDREGRIRTNYSPSIHGNSWFVKSTLFLRFDCICLDIFHFVNEKVSHFLIARSFYLDNYVILHYRHNYCLYKKEIENELDIIKGGSQSPFLSSPTQTNLTIGDVTINTIDGNITTHPGNSSSLGGKQEFPLNSYFINPNIKDDPIILQNQYFLESILPISIELIYPHLLIGACFLQCTDVALSSFDNYNDNNNNY